LLPDALEMRQGLRWRARVSLNVGNYHQIDRDNKSGAGTRGIGTQNMVESVMQCKMFYVIHSGNETASGLPLR
jgi:hypothetical protein